MKKIDEEIRQTTFSLLVGQMPFVEMLNLLNITFYGGKLYGKDLERTL